MTPFTLSDHPHRRLNPLTGEWLLVSPHRDKRPWQGQVEDKPLLDRPAYDETCYLCPGNRRANAARNPRYTSTYVFENDFAALLPDTPAGEWRAGELLVARAERGRCRVICFSPRHDLSLAEMSAPEIRPVVDVWADAYAELAALPEIGYVQIFENKGQMMGCSNPHPHGQIWATETVPGEPAKELVRQQAYHARAGGCLLCDYLAQELKLHERIVCANDHFVVLVPFWALWPFETMVLPRRHCNALPVLSGEERDALADIFRRITVRYDNLFATAFPYSMGWHQAPTAGGTHDAWHLHAHFYPPLLRSADVKKFMVGFEMLGNPQRDITAESAAARLRALAETHFRAGVASQP
ncbi:MAG TPA: UDP-glucose--hexose-1-phosphate uridylyltransferase [Armatimonadota bacterium]|nr:UDP-glucose--hexose-1-phosphate uridylyltransferase [Armatimonadota bacterium]